MLTLVTAGQLSVWTNAFASLQEPEPVQSLWKIHGKNGVTDVMTHGGRVYSAGRDGHYRVYSIDGRRLQPLAAHRVSRSRGMHARTG